MAKDRTDDKLDTVIGAGTSVKGDLRVEGSLRLDGQVEGKVEVSETFMAGQKSLLKGELRCRNAVIAGRIEANTRASEAVELQAGSQVVGDVNCRSLVIQRDSFFEGSCSMSRDSEDTIHPV